MSLQRLSSDSSPEDLANAVRQDGGAIVKNFVGSDLLARIQRTLFDTLESAPNGVDEYFAGTQTRRVSRLFARTDWMAEVALHPLYLGAARSILQTPIKIWSGENQVDIAPDIQVGVASSSGFRVENLHSDCRANDRLLRQACVQSELRHARARRTNEHYPDRWFAEQLAERNRPRRARGQSG